VVPKADEIATWFASLAVTSRCRGRQGDPLEMARQV